LKPKLLRVIDAARGREKELATAAVDAPANPDGRWSAKDHLAHAAWWRGRDARLVDAVRTGSPPPPAVGSREHAGEQPSEEVQNAVVYRTYRDRPLSEIRDLAASSWSEFTAAVEACSEEDLKRPHPYAANELLWQTVLGIPYHTGEHLTYWYEDSGDEAHVETTQRWLRDMYVAVAPDAKGRANANYNLACYYARRGRAQEALPLLRDAFEDNAQLREWARQDSDLDPIRDSPALKELLAT
jgi:hypothetical protein